MYEVESASNYNSNNDNMPSLEDCEDSLAILMLDDMYVIWRALKM